MFKNIDSDKKSDKLVSFVGGDFLATIITTLSFSDLDWVHPSLKLIFIALGGIIGGFFGLLGQRIFKKLENYYDNR